MIHIRPATLPDLDSLVELLRLLFAIEADFDFEPQRQRRGLALLLVDPERASIMVAETEGKIVGMCSGQVLISTAEGGPALVVEDVVVQEA
ncbi:MAG: GNAT family N-acetyltransferase, partial [Desulfobulbaceae bacterium A2]